MILDPTLVRGVATNVTVQSDGKIIVVGSGALVGGTSRNAIAIIVRLNSNGLIDPEFADRGVAFLDTNQETKYTYAMETLTQLLVKMVLSFNNKAAVVLPDHREIAPITF